MLFRPEQPGGSASLRLPLLLVALVLSTPLVPAQQKRVYIAADDHTDYFWTADEALYEQVFLDTLDYYLALTDATAGNRPEHQSRWNCDGSLWMWTYERNKPAARFQDLIDKIRSGHVSVPLNALGVSLGGAPAEMVLRGMYYPGRIERRHGLRFPLAYLMENQTHPLGIASLWAGSGARWSWKGICACDSVIPDAGDREHEVYVARGLDGAEILMKWNSQLSGNQGIGSYAEAFDPWGIVDFVTNQAPNNGFGARHPYDVIGCFGHGWDNLQSLTTSFVDAAEALTDPSRLVVVSNELDFFEDFEATYDRSTLPQKSVSFGNEWELYVASLAEPSARLKRALEKLRAAEALAAIESQFDPSFAAARESQRDLAFMNWALYFEHNFGMVAPQTGSSGTAARLQWQRRLADEIDAYVDGLHADGVAALGRRIPATGNQRIFAFNPLGWTRTDAAEWPYAGPTPFHVVDVATQAEVPAQLVTTQGSSRIRFLAADVPSLGYRVYEVRPGAGSTSFPPAASVTGNKVQNLYYSVTLEGDGAITSLVDRSQGGRQFAALVGGRWLNDLGGFTGSVTVEDSGPVSVTLRADSSQPVQHSTRVTLYTDVQRIDVHNEITQGFDDVQTWSFGFGLEAPRVRHEEVGAILDARLDHQGGHYSSRNARYDWLTLNHFADISEDGGAGVTLSNADCYYFQLGDSTIEVLDTSTPRLSVLAGGRVANGPSNGWPDQGGDNRFLQRFALRPHAGYDATAAMRMALEHQNPLVCGEVGGEAAVLPAALFSALSVSDPRALLWAFKPSEEGVQQGLIARLWNVGDQPVAADLQLDPTPIVAARGTTHIESDQTDEPVGSGGLALSLGAQQMRTWRLLLEPGATTYCTAKTNSKGCTPSIASSGTPSASAGAGFVLSVNEILSNVPGILFYGLGGPKAQPFQGGFLCVETPVWRTPGQWSGGSGPCGGVLAVDFNTYVASGVNPALTSGTQVNGQFWSRDPQDPFSSSLSDAIEFTLAP